MILNCYSSTKRKKVYCFTEDDEFICIAESVALGSMDQEMTAQNMRELNNKKKQLRRLAKQHIPDIAVPSIQQLAIESGKSFAKPDLKVLPAVHQLDAKKQRKARTVKKAEQQHKAQREQPLYTQSQRDEDEALFKLMTGG